MQPTTWPGDLGAGATALRRGTPPEARPGLGRFSLGMGDRFGREADAQLAACVLAAERGVAVTPVWNKSNREHGIVGSQPAGVREAADAAVRRSEWRQPYFVDADHITLSTVDRYTDVCDFYTLDVAEAIGQPPPRGALDAFLAAHPEFDAPLAVPGIEEPLRMSRERAAAAGQQFLFAVQEAGRIYRRIATRRDGRPFVTEVSMDETGAPQTAPELLVILAALAVERIPAQTIAPRFSGRFNKGVDYVGDVTAFTWEFRADLAVVAFAARHYGLPANLKLSVHSGSDKFSLYAPMRRTLREFGAGVHLKTAGTTWLEELIGIADSGGEGLDTAKEIYAESWRRREELCAPYAEVIDVDSARLPEPERVNRFTSAEFTSALRHDQSNPAYNPHFRQLLHVAFKVAAGMGTRYLNAIDRCREAVSRNVTENLFERHIKPLFLDPLESTPRRP